MAWQVAARIDEIAPGAVKGVELSGVPVAIYNLDGQFFATHNICTHAEACLSDGYVEAGRIECPLHQGLFDIRTGQAVDGPVEEDLQTFPVRVDGTSVLVDV